MDQESLAQIQQLIASSTDTLRGELADSKRHAGVLAEGLRHELQLVAEGFQLVSTSVMPKMDSSLKSKFEKHAHSSNSHMARFRNVSSGWSSVCEPSNSISA